MVRAHPNDRIWLKQVNRVIADAISCRPPGDDLDSAPAQAGPVVAALLYWIRQIQQAAELPVLDYGRIVGLTPARAHLRIPTFAHAFGPTNAVVNWLLELFALCAAGQPVAAHVPELAPRLEKLKRRLVTSASIPRLLRAAHGLGLPFMELVGGVFQIGQGSRSRWLESTLTDRTPHIGVRFARNKHLGAAMLRQAGLPAPGHQLVHDAEAATRVAQAIGYPVVVKPADTDGGTAVAPGLDSPEEVKAAFARAAAHSANVLVEKHFEGRDYRLTVLGSELIWAAERIPGGVTGDGSSTVAALVEDQFAARVRDVNAAGGKYRLTIDDEARELLGKVGLEPASVPAEGRFVRLRRAANLALGGTVRGVFDEVHPDNADLAIRATRALRLDLAGIDLLIPDISRSWLEVGAAICEVNAQPDLGISGPHIYGELLRRLLPKGGRIPIVVVFGAPRESSLGADIARHLEAGDRVVGHAGPSGVRVGPSLVHLATGCHDDARILIGNPTVDAAVVAVDEAAVLQTGLPFDRFDVLVIAGNDIVARQPHGLTSEQLAEQVLKSLLPMCAGVVLTVAGAEPPRAVLARDCPAVWVAAPVPVGEIGPRVAEIVRGGQQSGPANRI
jgi:cyanophycin synthetase